MPVLLLFAGYRARLCCLVDRLANTRIRSATAEIPTHRSIDFCVGRVRCTMQQSGGRHDLACLAVAALGHLDFKPAGAHMLDCTAWRFEEHAKGFVRHRTSMRPNSVQRSKDQAPLATFIGFDKAGTFPCGRTNAWQLVARYRCLMHKLRESSGKLEYVSGHRKSIVTPNAQCTFIFLLQSLKLLAHLEGLIPQALRDQGFQP
jgi:hypothetical protein